MSKKEEFNQLKIDEGGEVVTGAADDTDVVGAGEVPFSKYPRPQFKRDSFFNLNGKWDCGVVVPFPLKDIEEFSYYTTFSLPADFIKDHVFLNFGAVDQIATVYIDDKLVGTHEGGYTPFSFDITDFVAGNCPVAGTAIPQNQHKLQVDIIDHLDHKYPYGKQRKDRGGMWYTPVSGIWQTVWLESVPKKYIRGIKITPDLEGITLEIDGDDEEYTVTIKSRADGVEQKQIVWEKVADNDVAGSGTETGSGVRKSYIKIENPKLWVPEAPNLYDLIIEGSEDTIQSYFGLRTVGIGQASDGYKRLLLNGKPYFFNGVLDQGYWPQGIFLPNSERGWENDILAMKKLGFNTLRKHIKIEPALFYEACDRLGMVVFQDFVNNADYSFFHDTILPTIFAGSKRFNSGKSRLFNDQHFHKSPETRSIFKQTVQDTIKTLYNFPCICYYTIFNEGWGQFCADEMYDFVKERDSTRIIDSTSGWFKQKKTDVESDHVYVRKIKIKKSDKPIVISEFGGYSFKLEPNHYFNKTHNYGYRFFKDQSELEKAIHELYDTQIKPYVKKGLCAAIYTQLSDVEDETNGFLTYDRIPKVSESFIRSFFSLLANQP